jgi:5-methylcytosine-specific restriction endonuclease McrA
MSILATTWAFNQNQISCYQKIVLMVLANFSDHRGIFTNKNDDWKSYTCLPQYQIDYILEELEDRFLISIKDNEYTLLFTQEENQESPYRKQRNQADKILRNKTLRKQVFERDNYTCQSCGVKENLTIDHIIPVSKGGSNHLDNLQTLCGSCNSKKGAK